MDYPEKETSETKLETVISRGGYQTRHEMDRARGPKKGRTFAIGAAGAAILCVVVFAAIGVFALASGMLFRDGDGTGEGSGAGAIRVPTQSELLGSNRTPAECLDILDQSLLTLEIRRADGTSDFGTGFVISVDGYAVCSASLFEENVIPLGLTAHFDGGLSAEARFVGSSPDCGVALVKLGGEMEFVPVSAGNFDFVKRGETLLVAGAVYGKRFFGTAVEGMVASVGETVQAGKGESRFSVTVAYLDTATNPSLWGAPVTNDSGLVVGFCTGAVKNSFGDYAAIIPINAVYTLTNDILANS